MNSDFLTIALPKGKLKVDVVKIFNKVGYPTDSLKEDTRKLLINHPESNLRYLICRPTDIPTYVEYGAADIGIVGKDTIVEAQKEIFELYDLGFSYCRFVLAVPETTLSQLRIDALNPKEIMSSFSHLRVATKFPNVAFKYFKSLGLQPEIIPLHGNIELAPQVELAEAIVDIVSTGKTLKENNMVEIDEIFEATARLVANRVSYRLKNETITNFTLSIKRGLEDLE